MKTDYDIEQLLLLQDRLQADARYSIDKRQRAITDLYEQSLHNPTVKAYLDAWIAGGFENLEMALCAMAAELSRENTRLKDYAFDILNKSPRSYVVLDNKVKK